MLRQGRIRLGGAWVVAVALLAAAAGCRARASSLLMERHARGPLSDSLAVGRRIAWKLQPDTQSQEQKKVEISVTYASMEFLKQFFNNRALFGQYAGSNPYFLENLVFYIRITNHSDKRIRVNPVEFVMVDDRGNQYATINEDYVNALEEARTPVATTTRGVLEGANPGYFGIGVPVGKIFVTTPQGRFALIHQSSFQAGYLYPGVAHDGLIAFWNPSRAATIIRLLITNIKTDFDANDLPQTVLEFPFTFQASPL